MKNFKKFIPAVLAAATLASCSGDDLLVIQGPAQGGDNAGLAKNVTVETPEINFGAVTRAGYTMSDFKNLKFEDGDELRAYDSDFVKYDTYAFKKASSKFEMGENVKQWVPSPAYSVFPAKDFTYGTWGTDENGDETAMALVTIPYEFTIDSKSQWKVGVDDDNEYAYKTFLPMAGTAAAAGERNMTADLYFITSGIILVLDNTKGIVDQVKIVADADHALTGAFETNLKEYDGASTDNLPVLTTAAEVDGINQKNEMIVNMDYTNAVGSRYVVTLPIIQGDYESLEVYVGYKGVWSSEPIKGWYCDGNHSGANTHEPATFKRKTLYGVQYNPAVSIADPNGLSTALENKMDLTQDVKLTLSDRVPFKISAANTGENEEAWHTLYVPNMKANRVIVEIPRTIENTLGKKFTIQDGDPNNPYDGEVILRLGRVTDGEYTEYAEAINEEGIEINLKKADVTLAGYFTKPIEVKKVNSITFGDPESVDESQERNTIVGANASVDWTTAEVTEAVTIAEGAEFKQPIDLTSDKLAGEKKKNSDFKLTINGLVENTNNVNAGYAETTIGGGVYAQWKQQDQVKNLYTRGNVIVNQYNKNGEPFASKFAAIGTLEIQGDAKDDNKTKTLDLLCGYITLLKGNASKKTPLTVNNVEAGATGIGGIQDLTDTNYTGKKVNSTFTGSVWVGATLNSDLDRTSETGVIYTASQLAGRCAESQVTSEYKVYTTMDLKNIKWTGTDLSKQFNGNSKAIKNLKLRNLSCTEDKLVERPNAGTGLFSEVKSVGTTNTIIKNVTLNDVTFEQVTDGVKDADNNDAKYYDYANIGAIAGIVSGNVDLDKVVVTNAEFKGFGTKNATLQNVGILIGKVSAESSTIKVNITNGSEVKGKLSIKGAYHSLGGMVGYVEGGSSNVAGVEFNKAKVNAVTFEVTREIAEENDRNSNFGKVGKLVGCAWNKASIIVDDTEAKFDLDTDDLHFDWNKVTFDPKTGDDEMTCVFVGDNITDTTGHNCLGYSDVTGNVSLKIETTTYVNNLQTDKTPKLADVNKNTQFNVFR